MYAPQLPIPVQMYLWRQLRPFIRAKLGRVHEASCVFCQHAPGHHEMKEACTSLERVLVQNIHNELIPPLRTIISTVPRWRLIQASLPFILHATANLLNNKKDFQNLGPIETTLLYILHWIILDAAEECTDDDGELNNPFYYLFPVPTITLFVYLFAPLCNYLKDIDFKGNLRLENGQKIWYPIYECRHPETTCFTAHCKPKPRALWRTVTKTVKSPNVSDDIFVGNKSPQRQSINVLFSEQTASVNRSLDDDNSWVSSPKDKVFPETIPEESSSTEDEHVVIFTLPSLGESERMLDGVKEVSTIFAGEASIFHVAMGRTNSSSKTTLTIEQVTAISELDTYKQYEGKPIHSKINDTSKEKYKKAGKYEKEDTGKLKKGVQSSSSSDGLNCFSMINKDVQAATFLDVAVIGCLFISQWQEEGIFWALQFLYNRLRRINEDSSMQQMPRRRSNSLPIQKIEVSTYQCLESKKEEDDKEVTDVHGPGDTVFCADLKSSGGVITKMHTEISHTRTASEKIKKRMKMADLKAFVETKLLSKSEKALEKIGQEESKTLFEQECHRSLDTGEGQLTRQPSMSSKIFNPKYSDYVEHRTNLIKGKSMPSLRYIGDTKVERKQSRFYSQSCTVPNPIITVTEHTPSPSPDYMKRQGSMDSQIDAINNHGRRLTNDRKRSLARSQTDSNITYSGDEMPEAPGSNFYITKDGEIDLLSVLKAIHKISLRDNQSCTLRISELILNLIELLIDMGVLKHCSKHDSIEISQDSSDRYYYRNKKQDLFDSDYGKEEININAHNLMMNCVVHILRHLGCPHGCLDAIRGPHADFCRSQIQTIFNKLHRASSKQFSKFLRNMVRINSITEIIEFFHSYVGFCADPTSLLSPLNQKRGSSKSPDYIPQGNCATNFGAGLIGGISNINNPMAGSSNIQNLTGTCPGTGYNSICGIGHRCRNIESQIIRSIFKTMVTRCVGISKELKSQDNIVLYCDLRQFMTYVKETHSDVFRRVALSCILDSADRPNKKCNSKIQTTRVIRHIHPADMDQNADIGLNGCYTIDDRGTRKFLFKKRSTSSTCGSLIETELSDENVKISQSPLGNIRKKHHIFTPRQSERNLDLSEPSFCIRKSRKTARLKINGIVNWFRKEYGRAKLTDSHENSESPTECSYMRQPSLRRTHHRGISRSPRGVSQTLQKAKNRMEAKLSKIGLVKGKKKENFEEVQDFSRRNSFDSGEASRESEFVVLKERRMVPKKAVFEGIQRFSFLLETCQPGSVPDHHLMAAILDLPHAPVVARAAILLECAHLVHECNKGHWLPWMKLHFPIFRPSMAINNRSAPTGLRRTHILQRTAGKLFYQWAEAIGSRLEQFIAEDKQNLKKINFIMLDEMKHRDLIIEDEEEDFLDEASIKTYESQCPIALRLVACMLLLEITAFLREMYQTLPKSNRISTKERPPPWEKLYSREANRRWSMALSSMGQSQTSAQSLQSIAGDRETERKISFVLHEPDNESEGSSKSNVTIQGEEIQNNEKEKIKRIQANTARPFLLRRGTAGNTATGSFKRRSLKLRRGTKEGKEIEFEAFRRADSIQSKRKVSSLSDRSDTSEPGLYGEISGEESPGILSDDQPPESPSDSNDTDETTKNFPWMRVVVQIASNFNFYCCHQNFCHPFCHRRQMRASERLIKAVRKVYGEEFGIINDKALFDLDNDKKEDGKRDKRGRKISDQISSQVSPVRRKDSVGRKLKIDKSMDGSQSVNLAGIHRNSSKNLANHDSDYVHDFAKAMSSPEDDDKNKEQHPILKYIKNQVKDSFHAPLATLLKGAIVMSDDLFVDILPVTWELLLEMNQEVAAAAASLFIVAAVRAPTQATDIMHRGLQHSYTAIRINAILRFQVLWKFRYQVWPRMEESANLTFKVPPPGIEFTLPSPKIGIESLPVVDPPWMPQVKTKVEEVTINQERHRALVTATKTRKKQQTELIKKALQAQDDKKREERENFLITTIPITLQAAYEPSPVGDDHDENNIDEDGGDMAPRNLSHHGQYALSLFPSALCCAIIQIITLLDDAAVSEDGNAVYEMAYQVIWNCLVEDSALFLRYVLERLTRDQQDSMFKLLRHLIRFVPKLPQQAAFALYNYIIGYIMFYVRSPHEEGQRFIGTALSILWMVVHSVHGIMFKDLKQILRKEQCDASILLTANVPSAKKIIVHGPQDPDAGGIPSQFPVQEDTQFGQILRESLDFFGIEEVKHKEYFLVDYKTHQIHNPSSYVRDYYFFKRSQYPQLELVYMKPEDAFNALQRQELVHKFVEIGKVLLTWAILKNVDMVVQRVVFLHEELMKLPSFPRKALEADLDLYKGGEMGRELQSLDVMHKFMWVRLIARMFEAMAGNFAYSGDIHLFLNVLNGALILHSEDSCILRYVIATYINAAHNFKNIFSTNGYLLIMPTLLQLYSTHQTNKLVTTTVEYAVKQFYLMNRKPFILQMFGSVSAILDTDEKSIIGEAHKVPSSCLFNLLLSLETPSPDPLNIEELVKEEKPLKAIDFCYHDESEMVTILDCVSLCVMVISYAADSIRGQQMLIILEAIMPCYMQQIQLPTYSKEGKTEKEIINQLAIAIRTLVNNSEALTKYYNRPQKSSPDHKGSSQRNYGKGPYSPGFDFDEEAQINKHTEYNKSKLYERDNDDIETNHKNEFIRPRDTLLNIVGEFVARWSIRVNDLNKKSQDTKVTELLDSRCHIRLSDIAHSLLKISPYDPDAMACRGLKRYMNDILPSTEWSNDDMRPALTIIIRRLDKTFNKIYKKASIRRNINWGAASDLLKGIYKTLQKCPYIAHFQYLKSLLSTCQALIIGDTAQIEVTSSASVALMSKIPPQHFCSTVLRLIALQVISLGEGHTLENFCGGHSMFVTTTRAENILLNFLIPLFLRVGTGRKDVPKLRQSDICFALTSVLNTLWPPGAKPMQITATNLKATTDIRTGSLTFAARDSKTLTKISCTLYQVAFLALKIIIICFESDLTTEWPRILRTMKLLNKRNEASLYLWNFLEFVVTHRTPLYIQMLPFIIQKIEQAPISDHERNMQSIIRETINGRNMTVPKSRGALLTDLFHELRKLKEEIEDHKLDELQTEPKRSVADMHQMHEGQSRTQRPSLLIDLLTGDLGSRAHSNRTPVETPCSNSTITGGQPTSYQLISSTSNATMKSLQSQKSAGFNGATARGETITSQLNPNSPNEDSSSDSRPDKPRLQRSMGQSKRTFRLRKTRQTHVEVNSPKTEQAKLSLSSIEQQCEQQLNLLTTPTCVSEATSLFNISLDTSSIRSRCSFSIKQSENNKTNITSVDQSLASLQQQHLQQPQQPQHHLHCHQLHFQPQSNISLNKDTSSISGYRESCNVQLISLESSGNHRNHEIPLASPDLPSTSRTTTNYIAFDENSPEYSKNSNSVERAPIITQPNQHMNFESPLLMVFQTQDEDTLI